LWSAEEWRFIADFAGLPKNCRALLVRMVMRKGVLFRASRLKYPEIGDTEAALSPLVHLGWVDDDPDLDVDQLQGLLNKAELLDCFLLARRYARLRKSELVLMLRAQHPESKPLHAWCERSHDRICELAVAPLCERLRLIFFGNFHQDWTEFVLTDLGVFAYEKIPSSSQGRPFGARRHFDAFEQLYRCRQWLDAGMEPFKVIAAIPPPVTDCDWLEDRRQRLLFQAARASERAGDPASALTAYSACAHPGARLRTIRLKEQAHEWESARNLCLTAQQHPENEAERQGSRRLLARLNRRLGIADDTPRAAERIAEFDLVVDVPNNVHGVECRVRDCLVQQTPGKTTVHYVENGLVNSLFGLLCWNVVFAPVPGAFFHGFQYAPADLSSVRFRERRQNEFAECLAELDSDRYKSTIRRFFEVKAGIQSPFVAWGLLSKSLLESALTCIPAAHLKIWFEWILHDVRENRAGFPDLVQFWPLERRYRMIEVKAPGDRLQDNQRRFLELCASHRIPVSVCRVRWSGRSSAEPCIGSSWAPATEEIAAQ
jgi:hypothetical protein